jgi:1-acyl-sn-glycerol-3-phosphate acyltransferase
MIEPNLKQRGRPYNPNPILRRICAALLKIGGWRVIGQPPSYAKYVLVAAPHTTNWDFVLFILIAGYHGIRPSFTAKDSLFRPAPLGMFMRAIGGVAIDRSKSNNLVTQAVEAFRTHDEFILLVTPEGTRKWTPRWKTGFYHIAVGAGVPIGFSYVDYQKKEGGFGPILIPTGDIEGDLRTIQAFYADKKGMFPHEAGPVLPLESSDTPIS